MTSAIRTGLAMAETFTLKAVTAWPKTASENRALTIFSERVEQEVAKKAPGELKIQSHWRTGGGQNTGSGSDLATWHGGYGILRGLTIRTPSQRLKA
jgi:hypothetical protein